MYTKQTNRSNLIGQLLLSTFWAAVLLIVGLWFWFFLADSAGYVAAAIAITAVLGLTWQQSRAQARRRKAALDAYADREIARADAHSAQRRLQRRLATISILDKP